VRRPRAGAEAPPADLGGRIIATLTDRWTTLHELLEAVRKKAGTRKVHDLRIALRRMSSAAGLLEHVIGGKAARKLAKRLDKTLEALSEVRDVQVQRKEILRMTDEFPALRPLEEKLHRRERRLEEEAEKRLAGLDVEKWSALYESLLGDARVALSSESLAERHRSAIVEAVDRRFSAVIDARRALDVADLRTMHKMRVAFKKFRYMVEVLQPVLVGMGRAQLDSMQAFQTMMGDVHDLDVLNTMVAEHRADHAKDSHELVAAQDDIGRRLLQRADLLMASADEIFTFWNQSYLPR
jgi:CHAD domain-containing protein